MKNLVIPITLMSLVFCIFITITIVPLPARALTVTLAMITFLSVAVVYRYRDQGPFIKKIGLSVVTLFSIGFGLYLGTGNFTYFLLGIFSMPLVLIWVNYLRHPPHLWKFVWLFRRKRQAEAAQYINEWIKFHPGDWKALIMRSDFHLNRGQIAEAEQDSRTAIRSKPDYHEGYNQLGRSLMIMAQYAEARQAFEAAQKLKSNSGYLANLGIACYRLGDFPAAVEALTQANRTHLDHQFYNLTAYYFLGRSLENMGEQKKAQDAFKKMKLYANDIKVYIEQTNAAPDYPETVASRADLAEIQRLLN